MAGERDLGRLLAGLDPRLGPQPHVYVVVPDARAIPDRLRPFATVREPEGLTLVVAQQEADRAGLSYDYVAALITLHVRSDLAAVGLTAAVSTRLAAAGISCNVIAGYFHDHLLLPWDRGAQAVELLRGLAAPD